MGSFKSAATRRINALRHTLGVRRWHRNYYEHTIDLMPNLIHGIIWIVETVDVGATHASPLRGQVSPPPKDTPPRGLASGSLGAIVRSFKSAATRRINALRHTLGARRWHRNYYEHTIDLMPHFIHGIAGGMPPTVLP